MFFSMILPRNVSEIAKLKVHVSEAFKPELLFQGAVSLWYGILKRSNLLIIRVGLVYPFRGPCLRGSSGSRKWVCGDRRASGLGPWTTVEGRRLV